MEWRDFLQDKASVLCDYIRWMPDDTKILVLCFLSLLFMLLYIVSSRSNECLRNKFIRLPDSTSKSALTLDTLFTELDRQRRHDLELAKDAINELNNFRSETISKLLEHNEMLIQRLCEDEQ